MKKFLLSMLGVLIALPGIARDFTYEYEGQTLTYTVIDEEAKTASVASQNESASLSGIIVIPEKANYEGNAYTITSIADNAFIHCNNAIQIIVPNTVTSIGGGSFAFCSSLQVLDLGEGVKTIGADFFTGLTSLRIVTSRNPNPPSIENWGTVKTNAILYVPENAIQAYGSAAIWKDFTSIKTIESENLRGFTYEYEGQTLTYTVIDEDAKICKIKSRITDSGFSVTGTLIIPEVAKDGDTGYSVTKIGDYAFSGCSGLTSVTIPSSIQSIGDGAFSSCSGLTDLVIEDSDKNLHFGEEVFTNAGLRNVYLGRDFDYEGQYTSSGPFYNSKISELTISSTVTKIAAGAFHLCESLTSVEIPNSVTSIGKYAFYGCSGMTSVIFGNSVSSIGNSAFSSCSGLKKSAYPSGLSNPFSNGIAIQYPREGAIIEDGFVYGPEKNAIYFAPLSLEGEYIIPNSVTEIGSHAFYGCSGLTYLVIEDSDKNLHFGEKVFESAGLSKVYLGRNFDYEGQSTSSGPFYNSKISELTISSTVTKIATGAFHLCESLTSVEIPNSVTSIGANAFNNCSVLKTLTVEDGQSPIAFESAVFDGTPIEHLYIGRNWSCSEDKVISTSIKSVEIGNSVTELPSYAFKKCSGLTSVIIGNSVNSIGIYAFDGCKGLTSVIIPNSVTSIGGGSFRNCSGLTSVTIPSSVIEIQYQLFSGCSGLTSVTIPNSVTKIGGDAFCNCSGLTSVIIPNSVTYSLGAFSGCSSLKKSAYPSGLDNPFNSYGLAIEYPREGAIIEDGFVYGPEKKAIYFAPLSLDGEFDIPNSVTSIGENAFYGCSGLTSVKTTTINPPVMNDNSFEGLYDTAALSVPEDAVTVYLATNWSLFENLRIGDSETAAQTYNTGNLKYMLIPGKTQEDKNLAVVIPGDYSSLTEVTIPERFTVSDNGTNDRYYVDGIGFKAFNGCSRLATVTFNSRNASKAIGDYAFAGTKISELTIPETVEAIGNHAFDGCNSLTGIVIPCSVKAIGDYAFYDAPLNKITLNEGLETIGERCFTASGYSTKRIESIYIPSTLTSVGAYAFNYVVFTSYVNISDLEAWCNIDFGNSSSNPAYKSNGLYLNGELIENLVIPESVKAIKNFAFFENDCLKSVKFNEGLQSIGESAFMYCSGLATAVIPGNVTAIGDYAFYNYSNLGLSNLTLAYGAEQIEIGRDAFSDITSLSWDRPIESLTLDVSSLQNLTIGNSVKEIQSVKFKGVIGLSNLTLGNSLTAIGDEAFSGCTALTEVILPPSVETIGASAFAGNSKLTSIIMGHNVKTIGEKAYDLCPAQTVSITAQTPPAAPDNTFSNYTGSLYVQGKEAADAYYNADFCWFQFEGHVMIEPTELKVEGDKTLNGKPGDTFQLTATLYPTDVTLPQIFWRSTNPDIATVDANGLVTLHADMSEVMAMAEGDDDTTGRSCKIVAESLYANGPVAEFTVNDVTVGIEDIVNDSTPSGDIDFSAPVQVYNFQGVMVGDNVENLSSGIYIVRQGNIVKKIAVK